MSRHGLGRNWLVGLLAFLSLAGAACSSCGASTENRQAEYMSDCSAYADQDALEQVGDHWTGSAVASPEGSVDLYDLEYADLGPDDAFGAEYTGDGGSRGEAAWNDCKTEWWNFRTLQAEVRDGPRDPFAIDRADDPQEEKDDEGSTTTTGPDLDDVVEITTTTTAPPDDGEAAAPARPSPPPAPPTTSAPTTPATAPPTTSPPPPPTTTTTTTTVPPAPCHPPAESIPGVVIDWGNCEPFVIAGTCTSGDDHGTGSASGWSQKIWGTVDPAFAGRSIRARYYLYGTSAYRQSTTGTVASDGSFRIYSPVEDQLEEYTLDRLDVALDVGFARIAPPGRGEGHEEVTGPDAGRFFVSLPAETC